MPCELKTERGRTTGGNVRTFVCLHGHKRARTCPQFKQHVGNPRMWTAHPCLYHGYGSQCENQIARMLAEKDAKDKADLKAMKKRRPAPVATETKKRMKHAVKGVRLSKHEASFVRKIIAAAEGTPGRVFPCPKAEEIPGLSKSTREKIVEKLVDLGIMVQAVPNGFYSLTPEWDLVSPYNSIIPIGLIVRLNQWRRTNGKPAVYADALDELRT